MHMLCIQPWCCVCCSYAYIVLHGVRVATYSICIGALPVCRVVYGTTWLCVFRYKKMIEENALLKREMSALNDEVHSFSTRMRSTQDTLNDTRDALGTAERKLSKSQSSKRKAERQLKEQTEMATAAESKAGDLEAKMKKSDNQIAGEWPMGAADGSCVHCTACAARTACAAVDGGCAHGVHYSVGRCASRWLLGCCSRLETGLGAACTVCVVWDGLSCGVTSLTLHARWSTRCLAGLMKSNADAVREAAEAKKAHEESYTKLETEMSGMVNSQSKFEGSLAASKTDANKQATVLQAELKMLTQELAAEKGTVVSQQEEITSQKDLIKTTKSKTDVRLVGIYVTWWTLRLPTSCMH